jgi:hypothetical protein
MKTTPFMGMIWALLSFISVWLRYRFYRCYRISDDGGLASIQWFSFKVPAYLSDNTPVSKRVAVADNSQEIGS